MEETIRKSHQITSTSTRLKSPQRGFEVKIYAHASPGLHTSKTQMQFAENIVTFDQICIQTDI